MDFVPVLAMISLVITIINLLKYLRSGDTNGTVTTLSVLVAGVVVIFLVAETDFAAGISIADRPLSEYNNWSLLFIGLTIASMSAFANDLRKSLDNTTTSRKPNLTTLKDTTGTENT